VSDPIAAAQGIISFVIILLAIYMIVPDDWK
jgi:hypothetical protein